MDGPLVSEQFNLRAIALIRYRIIENYVTLVTCNNIFFRISPNWTGRNLGIAKLPIDAVVTEMLPVVCKVGRGVVDLAYQ